MIPAPVYDIALHGTSLTATAGANWQIVFKSRMLAEQNKSVTLYDKGVSGASSAFILGDAQPCPHLKPWGVVIEAGANDVFQGVPITDYRDNVLELIDQYKVASPASRLFLMTMNPFVVTGSITAPVKEAMAEYYQAMRDLAASTPDVGLIDVYPDYGSPTTVQIPDGVHPTLATQSAVLVPKLMATFTPLMT